MHEEGTVEEYSRWHGTIIIYVIQGQDQQTAISGMYIMIIDYSTKGEHDLLWGHLSKPHILQCDCVSANLTIIIT